MDLFLYMLYKRCVSRVPVLYVIPDSCICDRRGCAGNKVAVVTDVLYQYYFESRYMTDSTSSLSSILYR